MFELEGKCALITGASGGIGGSIARALYGQGAKVALSGTRIDPLKALADDLGDRAFIVPCNLSDVDAVKALPQKASEEMGGIDILVNNAGITKDNLLMRITEEDFDKVIEVNLKSVFNLTKAVIRPMMKQRAGSIINMSSVVGLKGNAGQSNYAASKAGIVGFSKSVALELGSRNIRSNVVAPGFIETEMTAKLDEATVQSWRDGIPLKRGGQPIDIANACVFLGSDMSSYITGQTLSVDGGMLT